MNIVSAHPETRGAIVIEKVACNCNDSDCKECAGRAALQAARDAALAPPAPKTERDRYAELDMRLDRIERYVEAIHDYLAGSHPEK